jgi:hypothetical protein
LEAGRGPFNPASMRFFFHIVDKYGISPDSIGCEHADQDAAVLHAGRITAELAKTGEFFRSSVVLVARATVPNHRPVAKSATAATAKT